MNFGRLSIWIGLAVALIVPIYLATLSPFLQYRSTMYVSAGFAGVVAMGCLLIQPLLAAKVLPGLSARRFRHGHIWVGVSLLVLVIWHVYALWRTSPPDVMDALLFRSPTAFSIWGVLAMWAVFLTTLLAVVRKNLRHRAWRKAHVILGAVIVGGSITHALLIEGTMEPISKWVLCILVGCAFLWLVWRELGRRA